MASGTYPMQIRRPSSSVSASQNVLNANPNIRERKSKKIGLSFSNREYFISVMLQCLKYFFLGLSGCALKYYMVKQWRNTLMYIRTIQVKIFWAPHIFSNFFFEMYYFLGVQVNPNITISRNVKFHQAYDLIFFGLMLLNSNENKKSRQRTKYVIYVA